MQKHSMDKLRQISTSGRFLRLSKDAQVLYFYLAMNKGDGVLIDVLPIMRLCGASNQEIKELRESDFIAETLDGFIALNPSPQRLGG